MLNFCTLFDSNYLSRGLAMYESLEKYNKNFHLYIFAFNEQAYSVLQKLSLKHTTVISLGEFEDETLLALKPTRSRAEYCWTCTPSTILYVLEHFQVDNCTYIDADLLFYSDPQQLIDEMGSDSSLIISHRYTPKYAHNIINGIYCVQFMTFKNNTDGLTVLKWWREACNEWCYNRIEDGKFGDQKYLDDWTVRFKGVHDLKHLGGGVAPWNVQQYDIYQKQNEFFGKDKISGEEFKLVFYHFHGLKFLPDSKVDLCEYELSAEVKELLYKPYIQTLLRISTDLLKLDNSLNANGIYGTASTWTNFSKSVKRKIKGNYNIYNNTNLV